ncbi:MAG TPA: phosphatase PAP2 family protein [Ignavibacteriaceae bacterium]|nr:phosphatase PAP2 family protein [Ignavibacteriaceae bacterium]
MADFLYSIDLSILYFFNHTLSAGFLDKFFSIITNVNNWYIAYFVLLGISFFKGGKKGKIAAVGVLILIIFSDQISQKIIKEIFLRVRPCKILNNIITPLGCDGNYSFPSNHAVNNFAAACFFYRFFPNLKWLLFGTASLVAISRIYLGLHYPSDILGGAAIGCFFGWLFSIAALKLNEFLEYKKIKKNPTLNL